MASRLYIQLVTLALLSAGVLNGCSSNSSGGGTSSSTSTQGDATLSAAGGTGGDMASGGRGGSINIFKRVGSGPVEIRNDGSVDASFEPFMPSPNLGANPAIVSVDTTISVLVAEPAMGELYFQANQFSLFISDGDSIPFESEERATGLHIEQDVVLTLDLNLSNLAGIDLQNDLFNQGKMVTVDIDAANRGHLNLSVSSYFANSEIDTSGRIEGQNGGTVDIIADYSIVNHGDITAFGADSGSGRGGDAGAVSLNVSQFSIENTGEINTSGGSSSVTDGGAAQSIIMNSVFGIRNSGDLSAHGGDGITSAGSGSVIDINVGGAGDFINSGDIGTQGGAATQASGGSGNPITININGGEIKSSGDLITRGGDTQQTSGGANGGAGGQVDLRISGTGNSTVGEVNSGDIQLSGNIDSSGGNAPAVSDSQGGSAGEIYIENNSQCCSFFDQSQKISLLGYNAIDSSGGDGMNGGEGGSIKVENTADSNSPMGQIPAGNIINEARIDTSGGRVTMSSVGSSNGGCNGEVSFNTRDDDINQSSPEGTGIYNSGDIDARSGENNEASFSFGCAGVRFEAYSHITNSGNIDTSGGNDRGTDGGNTGIGNPSSQIEMRAFDGPITNSGLLTAKGGDGEFQGGSTSPFFMQGSSVSNSGDIDVSGGSADPALTFSLGGDGGGVELFGFEGLGSVVNSATTTIDGGAGETSGNIGRHIEDGFCKAGNC